MDHVKQFKLECAQRISGYSQDTALSGAAMSFMRESLRVKYSYNFSWMGRPIIQYPQDIVALQEIIWRVKPQLIIETGVAHGGGVIFFASMLEVIGGPGQVVGIDIDIRAHNRVEIEDHPMYKRIILIEGSSTDDAIFAKAQDLAKQHDSVMIVLDSNHSHEHVLNELRMYSKLVTLGSYIVVFDGIVEHVPEFVPTDRPWGKSSNPLTATLQFMSENRHFQVDTEIEDKLVITAAPCGYLRRIA